MSEGVGEPKWAIRENGVSPVSPPSAGPEDRPVPDAHTAPEPSPTGRSPEMPTGCWGPGI